MYLNAAFWQTWSELRLNVTISAWLTKRTSCLVSAAPSQSDESRRTKRKRIWRMRRSCRCVIFKRLRPARRFHDFKHYLQSGRRLGSSHSVSLIERKC
jgi:hypothetical protein